MKHITHIATRDGERILVHRYGRDCVRVQPQRIHPESGEWINADGFVSMTRDGAFELADALLVAAEKTS